MKTYINNIENGVQIRTDDEDMSVYNALVEYLKKHPAVIILRESITFETPIIDCKYQSIPFSVLFDEMADETFVFVGREYDYRIIEKLVIAAVT